MKIVSKSGTVLYTDQNPGTANLTLTVDDDITTDIVNFMSFCCSTTPLVLIPSGGTCFGFSWAAVVTASAQQV